MKFSIIIPAYNEAEYIGSAIEALKNQTAPRHHFEIIVVDNNSSDQTASVAKEKGADKVLTERKQGTNLARQKGFEESTGEIVVFLDADCIPPPNWLQIIEKILTEKKAAAVSGPYNYGFKGLAKISNNLYIPFAFKAVPIILSLLFRKKAAAIMGGNFATYRTTIEKIGGLPPIPFYGDDAAIAMLISRKVGKVIFDPKFEVLSSARRFEKNGLAKTTIKYAKHYLKAYFELPPE